MSDRYSEPASDAADSDLYAATPHSPDVRSPRPTTPSKRKRDEASSPGATGKRRRPSRLHCHPLTMTPRIWQRIFSFLPPHDLGKLLRVNRTFWRCLMISASEADHGIGPDHEDIGPASAVWTSSRHIHFPGAPESLYDCTELEMWRFVFDHRCSQCGTLRNATDEPSTPPRIVWTWAKRLCQGCLMSGSIEVDLTEISIRVVPIDTNSAEGYQTLLVD